VDLKPEEMKMPEKTWVIMPFVDLWYAYTLHAAVDVLTQTSPCRLLLVDNGSGEGDAAAADDWLDIRGSWVDHTAMIWHHKPALTLSAAWNAALRAAWAAGCDRALVVNNDIRLHAHTLELLHNAMDETGGLFVSAVNVAERFDAKARLDPIDFSSRGGPDYSCFLISKECHNRFPFDEQFTYCNDLDHHRRIMLEGEGKRIFSVCVPYLHYASRTINSHPELARQADRHRELYREKWGGPVNEERWLQPYAHVDVTAGDGPPVTTPELQRACLA
jgi:hypothetical protein